MARTFLLLLMIPAALLLLTPAAAQACAGADVTPDAQGTRAASAATLCLVNAERTQRGLRPLRRDRALARAGRGHVLDMIRRSYFAHDGRDGRTAVERIRDAGYDRGAIRIVGGENLAWARVGHDTPAEIVAGWMDSPPHRQTMLHSPFHAAAVVIGAGVPEAGLQGSTYALELGA